MKKKRFGQHTLNWWRKQLFLPGPQIVRSLFEYSKLMVLLTSVNPKRATIESIRTLSSIMWCWIWGYTLLSVCRKCLLPRPLQNNDPSQRSGSSSRRGRCSWWCGPDSTPCNIVGWAVDFRVVKSGESPPLTHAWYI